MSGNALERQKALITHTERGVREESHFPITILVPPSCLWYSTFVSIGMFSISSRGEDKAFLVLGPARNSFLLRLSCGKMLLSCALVCVPTCCTQLLQEMGAEGVLTAKCLQFVMCISLLDSWLTSNYC